MRQSLEDRLASEYSQTDDSVFAKMSFLLAFFAIIFFKILAEHNLWQSYIQHSWTDPAVSRASLPQFPVAQRHEWRGVLAVLLLPLRSDPVQLLQPSSFQASPAVLQPPILLELQIALSRTLPHWACFREQRCQQLQLAASHSAQETGKFLDLDRHFFLWRYLWPLRLAMACGDICNHSHIGTNPTWQRIGTPRALLHL